MSTNYFSNCSTVEEIKILYRKLAMQHHPDRGGDTATMQEVNKQYQAALKGQHGTSHKGTDGKEHKYYYNAEVEQEIMDKISSLCGLCMESVEIALIGTWIWISGDTKQHKEALKELGCRWHGRRRCWYWHPPQKRRSRQSKGSLEDLAHTYGCRIFDADEKEERVAIAA